MTIELPSLDDALTLLDNDDLSDIVEHLSSLVSSKFSESLPSFLIVCDGAMPFAIDLIMTLDFPLTYEAIKLTRYSNNVGGDLHWKLKPSIESVKDRTVVILDDILDKGDTLKEVCRLVKEMGAKEVQTCVLLKKEIGEDTHSDLIGETIPNHFVFGYGMDYLGYYRNIDEVLYFPSH